MVGFQTSRDFLHQLQPFVRALSVLSLGPSRTTNLYQVIAAIHKGALGWLYYGGNRGDDIHLDALHL
jgi:hypothetical protein